MKQLEDQLQEVTQKHNKEQSDSEARRLKVCSIVALLWWHNSPAAKVLLSCNGTYIYTCMSGAYLQSSW